MAEEGTGREPEVASSEASVIDLVTRFALRRRADKQAYDEGTALAEAGNVDLQAIARTRVAAVVGDAREFEVALWSDRGTLTSSCTCTSRRTVCRHAVAVAHALWLTTTYAGARASTPLPRGDLEH